MGAQGSTSRLAWQAARDVNPHFLRNYFCKAPRMLHPTLSSR